jgi:BON domain
MADSRWGRTAWKVGAGLAVGFAAVATGLLVSRSGRRLVKELWQGRKRTHLEDRALDRLWSDAELARRPIDVAELGAGVVELAGEVASEDEARRAVALVQDIEGVHAVVNKLAVAEEESRLERARRHYTRGDDAYRESRWYGAGVGVRKGGQVGAEADDTLQREEGAAGA